MEHLVDVVVARAQGPIFAPAGVSSPASDCTGCCAIGGTVQRFIEPTSGQDVPQVDPEAGTVTLRHAFSGKPARYPDAIFRPAPSRYTLAAQALCDEAVQLAGHGDPLERAIRLARGVAKKFPCGHPEVKHHDGLDDIPHLAFGLTEGSCIDIHTCLIAAFRAAGIEAGYLVGDFFPDTGPCTGGHCWVVTRIDETTQEWDVSHFLQIGRRDIEPALNPKGCLRVPVGQSMDLSLPGTAAQGVKLLVEPMVVRGGTAERLAQRGIRHLMPAGR